MSNDLGLSNFEIEIIINSNQNEDSKNNFVGVFPSDKIKREKSNAKHPFLISNTEEQEQKEHGNSRYSSKSRNILF